MLLLLQAADKADHFSDHVWTVTFAVVVVVAVIGMFFSD